MSFFLINQTYNSICFPQENAQLLLVKGAYSRHLKSSHKVVYPGEFFKNYLRTSTGIFRLSNFSFFIR